MKKHIKLTENLDNHIWSIFDQYIEIKGILFSDPEHWEALDDRILFRGEDGCMGCYDKQFVSIPMKFFINPDEEFPKLIKEIKDNDEKEKKKREKKKREKEYKEFQRLKKKFDER